MTHPKGSENLSGFLARLEQGYERQRKHHVNVGEPWSPEYRRRFFSLQLGNFRMRWQDSIRSEDRLPAQVTVIGPTQAGKSSVINWLLGEEAALASPLAGFTRHPQGFAYGCGAETIALLERFFAPLVRRDRCALPQDEYGSYALTESAVFSAALPGSLVIWDTPDFDSIESERYRGGLLRAVALADLLICVLSKDKYADRAVWDMLRLIEPLGITTLIVLNKTPPAARETLERSLAEKWRQARSDATPPVITLPYLPSGSPEPPGIGEFRTLTRNCVERIERRHLAAGLIRYLRSNWQQWMEPVRLEQRAEQEWRLLLEQAGQSALEIYRRDYLDHPYHYATFQRALAELLTLLEVPGLASVLAQLRKVITWPVRQLGRLGRRLQPGSTSTSEPAVLQQAGLHALFRIRQGVADAAEKSPHGRGWWLALGRELGRRQSGLVEAFAQASTCYARDFEPEVERTARGLYDKLREHPAVLNSLRATRVTTDAAALAVGLHTGGIGLQDFVIAPAMLSLTSLLTESALGHYIHRANESLKRRQAEAVAGLVDAALLAPLARLPETMEYPTGFRLTAAAVEAAEAELNDKFAGSELGPRGGLCKGESQAGNEQGCSAS